MKAEVIILTYKDLYFKLFAAITDALADLQSGRAGSAMEILLRVSREAEEAHMDAGTIPDVPLE